MRRKTSMNAKLILMALGISLIAALIGLVGILNTNTLSKLTDAMYSQNLKGLQYSDQILQDVLTIRLTILRHYTEERTEGYSAQEKAFQEYLQELRKDVDGFNKTQPSSKESELIDDILKNVANYTEIAPRFFELSRQQKKADAKTVINSELTPLAEAHIIPDLQELQKINEKDADAADQESKDITSGSLYFILGSLIVGLMIALLLAYFISRSISKPVSRVVTDISDSSSQIGISSTQLSLASQQIANGASEQASQIEETTAAMEELASMVKQNVENAKEASILANKSSDSAKNGFEQMEKMVESMTSISKSADEIRNVIDVIDDIAFQTNMLALNAAVEAARAGEAGMGFAVVADEVKNLANRSAESSKETAAMIKQAIQKIEEGMDTSKRLSEIFKDILGNSKKVNEMTLEVETASRQQDEGISQVNKAIIQFDTVVQNNASSSEETASAAEELQTQVENLNGIVADLYVIVTGKEYTKASGKSAHVENTSTPAKPQQKLPIHRTTLPAPSAEEEKEAPKKGRKISFEDDEEFEKL